MRATPFERSVPRRNQQGDNDQQRNSCLTHSTLQQLQALGLTQVWRPVTTMAKGENPLRSRLGQLLVENSHRVQRGMVLGNLRQVGLEGLDGGQGQIELEVGLAQVTLQHGNLIPRQDTSPPERLHRS